VIVDSIAGLATACFLLHCAQVAQSDQRARSLALGLLEHRAVLFVGSFSYSLYLIHDPLIAWWHRGLFALGLSDEVRFWSLILFAVPFCVLSAYVLYALVERRFIARHGAARAGSVASPVAKHA
jgi:peptidoglycan/LPS O-acetylase OafA/YrhL